METTGVHLWLVLWKASKALEGHSRRSIEVLGMCRSDFGVLEALLHKGPLSVSELGKKVLLTSGSITTAIDRLEGRGLVKRGGDDSDRRTRIVHLTKSGRKVIEKVFKQHERDMDQAVAGLSREEREALGDLLRKLGRSADRKLNKERI